MTDVYVLDYFMSKNLKVLNVPDAVRDSLQHGDKIVYFYEEKGVRKESIGIVVGYPLDVHRQADFERVLELGEHEDLMRQQDFALKVFPLFKKKFKEQFKGSKPITARYNPLMDQIYFYFYSEERYVFSDFVKQLRDELGKNIFLFQVGARDMMRLDPNAKAYIVGSDCGMLTACQSYGPLPSVEVESMILQGVDWRDMERLKWRCGKLKCSLMYELEIYQQESKLFPARGTSLHCPGTQQKGVVSSYNIITREVALKTEEGTLMRIPLETLKAAQEPQQVASAPKKIKEKTDQR